MYLIREKPLDRPWQGDIYRDVNLIQDITYTINSEGKKEYDINEITYNYSIILTQECDLEQDYVNRIKVIEDKRNHIPKKIELNQDKYIPMILMAPAYLLGLLRYGEHLTEYGQTMQKINSDEIAKIKKNNNKRYHFLKTDIDKNIPELIIDFKHFFTMSRDIFYEQVMNQSYLASLTILFREELSQRFSNYFSRIGIPNNIREIKLLTDSLRSGLPLNHAVKD